MPIQFSRPLPPVVAAAAATDFLRFLCFTGASAELKKGLQDACAREVGIGECLKSPGLTVSLAVLPVFAITLNDLLKIQAEPPTPRAGGWRIAAGVGPEVLAADIQVGKLPTALEALLKTEVPRVSCMRRGPDIKKMLDSIASLPEAVAHLDPSLTYGAELVLFPGLFTEALWIRPETPELPCHVVPFHTLAPGLEEGKIVEAELFMSVMRKFAAEMAAQYKTLERTT